MSEPVRVFLSWHPGCRASAALAEELLGLLMMAFRMHVKVFKSSEIKGGEGWSASLRAELQAAQCAVLCLTPSAVQQPWIVFEAGAIGVREGTLVVPMLYGLTPENLPGPLKGFQALAAEEKQGWVKLIDTIRDKVPRDVDDQQMWLETLDLRWAKISNRLTHELPPSARALSLEERVTMISAQLGELRDGQRQVLNALSVSIGPSDPGPAPTDDKEVL